MITEQGIYLDKKQPTRAFKMIHSYALLKSYMYLSSLGYSSNTIQRSSEGTTRNSNSRGSSRRCRYASTKGYNDLNPKKRILWN